MVPRPCRRRAPANVGTFGAADRLSTSDAVVGAVARVSTIVVAAMGMELFQRGRSLAPVHPGSSVYVVAAEHMTWLRHEFPQRRRSAIARMVGRPARKSFFIGSALKAWRSVNPLDFSVDARRPLRL